MIKWTLEKRNIKDLKEHNKNPRRISKHDAKHLEISMTRFGLIDKPIINLNGQIIGGHQRKRLLSGQGVKEIECWVPDRELTSEEVDELNIRLNRNVGDFDLDILANQWDDQFLGQCGFKASEVPTLEIDEVEEKEKPKKLSKCPECGHVFERDS